MAILNFQKNILWKGSTYWVWRLVFGKGNDFDRLLFLQARRAEMQQQRDATRTENTRLQGVILSVR